MLESSKEELKTVDTSMKIKLLRGLVLSWFFIGCIMTVVTFVVGSITLVQSAVSGADEINILYTFLAVTGGAGFLLGFTVD